MLWRGHWVCLPLLSGEPRKLSIGHQGVRLAVETKDIKHMKNKTDIKGNKKLFEKGEINGVSGSTVNDI